MKLLILTSCTGEKHECDPAQLTLEDFQRGPAHVTAREKEVLDKMTPAEALYSGQQHVRLMRGVDMIREQKGKTDLEFEILSAGYGLIRSDQKIAPYEATFTGMKKGELREWAAQLNVGKDFAALMSGKRDLNLILLGDLYLEACGITEETDFVSPTLLFCGGSTAKKLPQHPNLKVVALSNPEAKRFSCGLVALKGEMAHRICSALLGKKVTPQKLMDPKSDVLGLLESPSKESTAKKKATATRSNPAVDHIIKIPRSWWDKPHRSKLRYFIPEWDDRVDPDYDFTNDIHSGGRGAWDNEVYAHQMYSEPNYDGILMSRAVADKGKRKAELLKSRGVHGYCRVPQEFPILGDCGAFDYIMQDEPPYTTEDVIEYYTTLGFNYGVSIDHLIVKDTMLSKDFRYELTISNAEEFLRQNKKAKLPWEPIGAVQGWDPESYAKAAAKYVKMGYRYLALGGLVRSTTAEILRTVEKVHEVVPSDIPIHLFGIARTEALLQFSKFGVRSVDSASYLRRAWLVAKDNYFTLDWDNFSSIRIPEPGKSFRAKRIVSEGRASFEKLQKLERECFRVLGEIVKQKISVDKALDPLEEYDLLISNERVSLREEYRRTLEGRPWEKCPCDICKKWGIQVIIFRGNNRNRRRGFHNTYVYYRLLQQVLNGENPTTQQDGQMELNLFQD